MNVNDLDINFIATIDNSKWLYGTGIKEPLIAIEGLHITPDDCIVMGKNNDSVSFVINGVKYCKFKLPKDDTLLRFANGTLGVEMDVSVVGQCSINTYKNQSTAQFIINEYIQE